LILINLKGLVKEFFKDMATTYEFKTDELKF